MTIHDRDTQERTKQVWMLLQKRRNGIFMHTRVRIDVIEDLRETAET